MRIREIIDSVAQRLGLKAKHDWFETNLPATLRVDIASLGWACGDAVHIRRLCSIGDNHSAFVVHDRLGNTLNNVAMPLLEFPEQMMLGSQWPTDAALKPAQTPFTFNRIRLEQ